MAPAVGPISVVQADTRYCELDQDQFRSGLTPLGGDPSGRLKYWWESARANALWAMRYGYLHRLYCLEEACKHEAAGHLFVAWCKLRALQHAIGGGELSAHGRLQTSSQESDSSGSTAQAAQAGLVLFLDSDAFWQRPDRGFDIVLQRYIPQADWSAHGPDQVGVFFGCNLPWNGEDRGRRQWNATTTLNGERGPPGTGVMLLLQTPVARGLLSEWWGVATWNPKWNRRFAWEQSALWELWAQKRPAAQRMRVLHDATARKCMRSMDPRHPSPIAHVAGGMTPSRREARLDALGLRQLAYKYNSSNNGAEASSSPPAWRSEFTRIGRTPTQGSSTTQSLCASQRIDVSSEGVVRFGPCLQ